MSTASLEGSWEEGSPIEFYDFINGTTHWRYNTSNRVQLLPDVSSELWMPLNISRSAIQQGSERGKQNIDITLPSSAAVADLWRPYPVSNTVGVSVYRRDANGSDALLSWIGRVVAPKFTPTQLRLLGEPSTTVSRKVGQIQTWQRSCMHVLYKQGRGLCNADKTLFGQVGEVETATGVAITSPAFAMFDGGRLAGGYIEWISSSGVPVRRSINSHTGSTVLVQYGSEELQPGTLFQVFPGCRHNWEDCENYFNNGVNYGGDLYAPERSPFNGLPVY